MVYLYAKNVPEPARFLLGKSCIALSLMVLLSIPATLMTASNFIESWQALKILSLFYMDIVLLGCVCSTTLIQLFQMWSHDNLASYFTRYAFRGYLMRYAKHISRIDFVHAILLCSLPLVIGIVIYNLPELRIKLVE